MSNLIEVLYKTTIPQKIASDPLIRMIVYRGQDRIDAVLMSHWLRMKRIYKRSIKESEYETDKLVHKAEVKANHYMLAFYELKKEEIL